MPAVLERDKFLPWQVHYFGIIKFYKMVNLIFKIAGSMIPETFEMIKGHPWLMQKNDFKTRLQSCTFYVFKLNIDFIFPAIFLDNSNG